MHAEWRELPRPVRMRACADEFSCARARACTVRGDAHRSGAAAGGLARRCMGTAHSLSLMLMMTLHRAPLSACARPCHTLRRGGAHLLTSAVGGGVKEGARAGKGR